MHAAVPQRGRGSMLSGQAALLLTSVLRHSKAIFFRLDHAQGAPVMDIFVQQIINGLTAGSVYALVALGYTMVYGIIGLINFAHGDVVMVGAMTATSIVLALVGHYGDVSVFVALGAALLVSIPGVHGLGLDGRAHRLPPAAPCPTAGGY